MSEKNEIIIPAKFQTIIRDFTKDLTTTFPEYSVLWRKWTTEEVAPREIETLFKYCTEVYPERFFDILYQNDDMFKEDSEINTRFLPAVEFRLLYHCAGVTDTTRGAIWKYLQLILMTVLNSVRDKAAFGDAADIFEGVDENVLQDKLNKTLEEIGSFFKNLGEDSSAKGAGMEDFKKKFEEMGSGAFEGGIPGMEHMKEMFENMAQASAEGQGEEAQGTQEGMPKAEDLHEHLKGLFDGKIGSLAKELAEEISHDVEHLFDEEGVEGMNPNDAKSTGDLINKMMKNPKKIMSLMKTISGKLQQKMKSGDISEEEIMKEAGELMGKMKGMKGMGAMNDMFKNLAKGMGVGGGGKGALNVGALQRMQKQMAMKERMRAKMQASAEEKAQQTHNIEKTADPTRAVFRLGEEDAAPEYSTAPSVAKLNDDELVAMFSENTGSGPSSKKKSKSKKTGKK
jgi:hypothetical protein